MKEIKVNNGRKISIEPHEDGIEIIHFDNKNRLDHAYVIPEGEFVMLLNYYKNCKDGTEKSDYIMQGKIDNTQGIEM